VHRYDRGVYDGDYVGCGKLGGRPILSAHLNASFAQCRFYIYKNPIDLPRRFLDIHRENTQKKRDAFSAGDTNQVRKTPFLEPFLYIKTIILPRQARDKHRESTPEKSGCVFLSQDGKLSKDEFMAWCAYF
jgi:hypothetical protein